MTNTLLKKISTRTVFGSKADVLKLIIDDEKNPVNRFLYRVYGQAKGYVSGTSRFSDKDEPSNWTALAGEFEAVNSNGEIFYAAICFLPAYVTGPIVEALKEDGNEGIEFGFDIYAKFDATAATSYIYLCEPLRKEGEQSPLDKMRSGFKALPGMIEGQAKQIEHHGKGKGK